jgi:hypothetical protein
VSAKLAEWARDNGLGRLVSAAEAWRYRQTSRPSAAPRAAYFTRSGSGVPVGHPVYPTERVAPSHYPTPSSRDWFSWSLR